MNKSDSAFNLMLPCNIIWLRIFAILLVYLGHSELHLGGGYGGTFFLTLSGYIVTRVFLQDQALGNKITLGELLSKRFLKIFPALSILVVMSVCVKSILHHKVDFLQVISVLTFTSNYYNSYYGHPNNGLAHLWTLSIYIQFIILYFLIFKYLRSRKNLTVFFIIVSVVCLGYRYLLISLDLGNGAYIYNSLETRIDAMSIGALLALNIEFFHEKNFCSWLNQPLIFVLNLVLIYFVGKFPLEWRNGSGFFIHAILYTVLIYQVLNYSSLLAQNTYQKVLSLLCFWFYFFHPWAFIIGHQLPFTRVFQVLVGALILIGIMSAFIFLRKKIKSELIKTLPKFSKVINHLVD